MSRGLKLSLVAVFAFGVVSGLAAWAAQDEHVPLSVSIAVPKCNGKRDIVTGSEAHFHVVIKNISTHGVSLWQGDCPWGFSNLSFEVTDASGQTTIIKKEQRHWKRSPLPSRSTISLDPNGNFVINVAFNPETWKNPPLPIDGKSHTVTIRAIYENAESPDTKKSHVWTGRVVSEKKRYEIW